MSTEIAEAELHQQLFGSDSDDDADFQPSAKQDQVSEEEEDFGGARGAVGGEGEEEEPAESPGNRYVHNSGNRSRS
jgi:hypothetical protein